MPKANIHTFFQPVRGAASNINKPFILPKQKIAPKQQKPIHDQSEMAKQPVIKPTPGDIPQLFPNDVAYIQEKVKNMNDAQRLKLSRNVIQPDKSFPFPKSSDGRTFLFKWLEDNSWLYYSPTLNGAFCLPCVLFW